LFAALSIVTIGAMGVAARINTNGFLGYLNDQGIAPQTLTPTFGACMQHGSWDFVRDNSRAWIDLLGSVSRRSASLTT
jgi:hypothetical protein